MTLIVSGLSIYLANRNEIAFDLSDIVFALLCLFLTLSVILFLILFFSRRFLVFSNILTGLVVALSLAIWVQSQILVWNFGQFNGQGIAWETWKIKMFIDGIAWVIIFAVSLNIFTKRKQNFKRGLVIGIYFLGSVSVLASFLTAPKNAESLIDKSTYKDIFTFHPQNNVLIILLDDFQSDYFNYLANTYPDELKELDGFTFYRNTISRYPTTKTSLPSLVTGTIYRNEKGYDDYVKGSYKNFNIMQAYRNKSYSTWFVGQLQSIYPEVISMENVASKLNNDNFYQLFEYLDYGAFRALPTFLKPVIYNQGNWFFTFRLRAKYPPDFHGGDVRFLELFEKNASVKKSRMGSFKFLHFFIPHAPWRVNENLQFDPDLKGEKGYIRQTRGAIRLASRMLLTLKKIGIYDQSEIVIMSDHGTGKLAAMNSKNDSDALSLIPSSVQSSSLALLLHKPANSKGKMITSDVPLELTDLACLLGLRNKDTTCRGFNMALAGRKRLRTFYYYEWQEEYWNTDHLPPMTEYIVNGPSYDPESYSAGKYIYSSDGIKEIPLPTSFPYTLGKEIIFSNQGNGEADHYIRAGWNHPETGLRWSEGPVAGLSFHLKEAPKKDMVLWLLGLGYVAHNKIKYQDVTVIVNEVPIGHWEMKDSKWYEAVIPKKIISDKTVNIVFKISNPMSPNEVENSGDDRSLGMGLASVVIEEEEKK